MTLLRGKWLQRDDNGRWWAIRCDGCGSERAVRASTAGDAVHRLGLKTVSTVNGNDEVLEHYCRACQHKGA